MHLPCSDQLTNRLTDFCHGAWIVHLCRRLSKLRSTPSRLASIHRMQNSQLFAFQIGLGVLSLKSLETFTRAGFELTWAWFWMLLCLWFCPCQMWWCHCTSSRCVWPQRDQRHWARLRSAVKCLAQDWWCLSSLPGLEWQCLCKPPASPALSLPRCSCQ